MMKIISLRRKLAVNTLLIFSVSWFCSVAVSLYSQYQDVTTIVDQTLQDSLENLAVHVEAEFHETKTSSIKGIVEEVFGSQVNPLQIWYKEESIYSSAPELESRLPENTGYVETDTGLLFHYASNRVPLDIVVPMWDSNHESSTWGPNYVEPWSYLEQFSLLLSESHLVPMLLILPLTLFALYRGIDKALMPLSRITRDIEQRSPDNLSPVSYQALPVEVHSLINALNQLLLRLELTLENERNFAANAAHELLTPLAAIKSEVQLCQRQFGQVTATMSTALNEICKRVDRATHTVEQLVMLARLDPNIADNLPFETVDLEQITQEVAADFGCIIERKELSFEMRADKDTKICGNKTALAVLCRNLLDNAVRYTPVGGKVNVVLIEQHDKLLMLVENTGKPLSGIMEKHFFRRFVRGPGEEEAGSGLGLSIVRQIVDLHEADIQLNCSKEPSNVRVEVRFKRPAVGSHNDGGPISHNC